MSPGRLRAGLIWARNDLPKHTGSCKSYLHIFIPSGSYHCQQWTPVQEEQKWVNIPRN